MGKNKTLLRKKNNQKRGARRALLSRRRFLENRLRRNRLALGRGMAVRVREVLHQRYAGTAKAVAPSSFSFLHQPQMVIAFIKKLKQNFIERREVFIVMDKVSRIDHSAILIMLSIMVRFKTEKIRFNGDFPRNDYVKQVFIDSGFFHILNINLLKKRDKFDFGNPNSIHTHASKNVDPALGPVVMENISKRLRGHPVVYKGLQRVLIELMQNSFNHAEPAREGDKHWWLSVNVSEDKHIASFSFIDYGVGIFESLNRKDEDSKWYHWKELLKKFNPENNAQVLRLILEGELHRTVTGQEFRGKGLPGIKEAMDRNLISKLFIITNDVFANVSENIYLTLPNNFEGTFVYWEVNDQTVVHPWNL